VRQQQYEQDEEYRLQRASKARYQNGTRSHDSLARGHESAQNRHQLKSTNTSFVTW
jgi:hypothetical protein